MERIKQFVTYLAFTIITLVFCVSGSVMAQSINEAPLLSPLSKQYVLEGEELRIEVSATDPNGDNIVIGMANRPNGVYFADHGDGTALLRWTPDYAGPNSSDASPFEFRFWASDGSNVTSMTVEVVVINNNRKPQLVAPETTTVFSGNQLSFEAYGFDPDNDPLTWNLIQSPAGMIYQPGNPSIFNWTTEFSDSGFYNVELELIDELGAADTAEIVVDVAQTEVYSLSADTVSIYPGETVTVGVNLNNMEAVSGFDIVINYDVTILTVINVFASNTRIADWEYFTYNLNNRGIAGDIRVTATADLDDDTVTPDLESGEGQIFKLNFIATGDLSYAGFTAPLMFVFRDPLIGQDNTMTAPDGSRIEQDMISYTNGYIGIKGAQQDKLGDINLNGVPIEIGDVIYYTSYFIYPNKFPLNPIQYLLSDVNQDGLGATIADLVYMINHILGVIKANPKMGPAAEVAVEAASDEGEFSLKYNSDKELGGIAVVLRADRMLDENIVPVSDLEELGLKMESSIENNRLRMVIYNKDGNLIPGGINEFFTINSDYKFIIEEIQLAGADGYPAEVVLKDDIGGMIPGSFNLSQNYPNPFNPATEISFSLPKAEQVHLTVYNLLGQEIDCLVDDYLTAGSHTVSWDGTDHNGSEVASGIYFYRLTAGDFSDKKKMILLK